MGIRDSPYGGPLFPGVIPGTQGPGPGPWALVPGPGTRSQGPGPWSRALGPGPLVPGPWALRLPACHIGTLAHWHIGTLPHYHISTLAHCHISTFSHVHRSKIDEITKMSRNRSPWLRLTRECATLTRTGLIKPMGCLPAPKKIKLGVWGSGFRVQAPYSPRAVLWGGRYRPTGI